MTLHFYVWLVLGGPHPVLVDAGCRDGDAASRGLQAYVSPAAMIVRIA